MESIFYNKVIEILDIFIKTQSEMLETIANEIVEKIQKGGRFFVFGTGHSHMVGEEFYARAGGLAWYTINCTYGVNIRGTSIKIYPNRKNSRLCFCNHAAIWFKRKRYYFDFI